MPWLASLGAKPPSGVGHNLADMRPAVRPMSEVGQSRRFWHAPSMSGKGGNLGSADCPGLPVEGIGLNMIQASKAGPRIMRYELTHFEWRPSGRSFRTSRVAFRMLTTGAC